MHSIIKAVSVIFYIAFTLNLPNYIFLSMDGPAPKFWLICGGLITGALYTINHRIKLLAYQKINLWLIFYFLTSCIWMLGNKNSTSAGEGLTMTLTTIIISLSAIFSFKYISIDDKLWNFALWTTIMTATLCIAWEVSTPNANPFYIPGESIPGRPAGLFINANIAAQMLLMSLLCLIQRGKKYQSAIGFLIAGIGIFLTLSRGGIACLILILFMASIQNLIPRFITIIAAIAGFTIFSFGFVAADFINATINSDQKLTMDRLLIIFGQNSIFEYSDQSRNDLIQFSIDSFMDSPFFGNGLGYTQNWLPGQGTHNMILKHIVEYGLIGLFIFPLFLLASMYSNKNRPDKWIYSSFIVVILWSIFSHNLLEQASFLLPYQSFEYA